MPEHRLAENGIAFMHRVSSCAHSLPANIVRVAIVDPNRLVREGLKRYLDGTRFQVVMAACSVDEALATADEGASIELFLIDAPSSLPKATEAAALIHATLPLAPIVLMANESQLQQAPFLLTTFDGFLLKDMSSAALVASLTLVMLGEKLYPVHQALLTRVPMAPEGSFREPISDLVYDLSRREEDILRGLVGGLSNKQIARHLLICEATVKAHVKAVLRKIRAANRTQAAIWGINHGLDRLPLNDPAPSKPEHHVARLQVLSPQLQEAAS
jgi:two-component system nitrate/nitrite response regulator NarL